MLYGTLAQCPVLGGKVSALDAAAAETMPGVRRVLVTASGVVVVADHFWQALQARKALKITWDPGSNARLDNAGIRALLESAANSDPGLSARADGDAVTALKSAQQSLHAVYELPLLAHATMEPMNCTADVGPGGCDLYVGTQVQQLAQAAAATAAGLEPGKVRVFTTLLGGGFGRRLDVDFIPAAVEASKALGAPVQVIWTREDDMTHDTYRPPAREEVSGGLDAGGNLIAWKLHITSPSITARASPSTTDPFDSVVEYAVKYPYAVPNFALSYSRREIGIDADGGAARRLGPALGRKVSRRRFHGGLHHSYGAGRRNFSGRRNTQGAQDHLRRGLRPNGQPAHRRVADRKRNRIRTVGGALG
jgi:isoquinoline 1-oxidoreductase beta subunit